MRKYIYAVMIIVVLALAGCATDASVASYNVSKDADMFRIDRRIVFYNGITDSYMLTIEGKCSIEDQGNQLEVICKVGPNNFYKHFLGLSDNVTYFAEQVESSEASVYRHKVIFKPATIVPDIEVRAGQ
ncbi:MAG: hypothetical protein KC414_13510 [Romboutsia sp.]|nr:hypothetical protein [Romboutsia sp.]